jgi:replicative DNA helicase
MNDHRSIHDQSQQQSLPHSEECENGLICSMILNAELIDECQRLPDEVFYLPRTQILLNTLRTLRSKQAPIDFPLIKKTLSDNNQLVEIGGIAGLNDILALFRLRLTGVFTCSISRITIAGE